MRQLTIQRFKRWPQALLPRESTRASDRQRAADLINAIDAGGMPLNPARVNDSARRLGLEVSRHAAREDTIARIRAAPARLG